MHWCHSEPSLAEMLSDPIVTALMAADRIAPEDLRASLMEIAGAIELRPPEVSGPCRS